MIQRWWWLWATALYAATRTWLLLVPLGLIPYPNGTAVMNDVTLYARWAQTLSTGSFPIGDQMWQYPPLAGPLLAIGAKFPPDPSVGLMLFMLAFDAVTFALLMWAGRSQGHRMGPVAWIIAGVAVGPVWLTRFDVAPALFAVLALLSVTRPVRSGAWMAVGALLKVWPVVLLLAVPRRGLLRALLGFAATSFAILLVILATMQGAGSFATEQRSRGLQLESVASWPFLVGKHLGWQVLVEYRYGAMEVLADGTQGVGAVVTIITVMGLLLAVLLRLTGRLDHAAPADIALVVLLFTVATSRVLSPQYFVWLAAVGAVCLLNPGTRMRPMLVLLIPVAVLGQVLYPVRYDWLTTFNPTGLSIQFVRVALLLTATIWGAVRLLRRQPGTDDVRVEPVEHVREAT